MDHALARDVIYTPLDTANLAKELERSGFRTRLARSQAKDRMEYLHRPDLGRRLNAACIDDLYECSRSTKRLSVIIADGLSSPAPAQHALPLLRELKLRLEDWELDDVVIATQARVALGDEIGSLRDAEAVAVLIGERPGLNAVDSLGAYLTYGPFSGRTDADRNCISNIRPAGLSYSDAAYKLAYLLDEARVLGGTGIRLKDASDVEADKAGNIVPAMWQTKALPPRSP
ncbi:ethanolamine ammonia-lyase light chain [Edaphobacter acidisoli]|uniref:Ethanolamine ammonia-lyase light chain n=2 Tax=Edaphobacter acidisoli TaxID=2040573 RepID=A0A916W3W8_9BACT|nr:ethanolamine ammonia-lyase light chain [Edaphobacter acidisoli]